MEIAPWGLPTLVRWVVGLMLVLLTDSQLLSPEAVCQNCLLADRDGLPRWRQGRLTCGHAVGNPHYGPATQFECQMGFRLAQVEG